MSKILQVCVVFLLLPILLKAQDLNMYSKASFINRNNDTLPYRILFPINFIATHQYPLVIVLHGSGESGHDNEAQLMHGGALFTQNTVRQGFPAIVIFPQCSRGGYWSNTIVDYNTTLDKKHTFQAGGPPGKDMSLVLGLLDDLLSRPYTDKNRVYVGGLSMGGMGTFELLRRKPDVFAAAFTICGGDNPLNAPIFAKKVPLWIFHGEKDNVVGVWHSKAMVDAIKQAGGHPKLTLYPNDGHNSWDDAFAEPDLLPWLFSHKK